MYLFQDSIFIRSKNMRQNCRSQAFPRKQILYIHIHGKPDDCFIIVYPIIKPCNFRQAVPSCPSRNFNHINLSVLLHQIAVYRTIIHSKSIQGQNYLTAHFFSESFLLSVWNRMSDRCRHKPRIIFNIIRKAIQKFPIADHCLTSQHLAFNKFFQQTIIFSSCCHCICIMRVNFFFCIASKNPSASHKIYCFKDYREFQGSDCCFQFFSVSYTDMPRTVYAIPYKRFFHKIFI